MNQHIPLDVFESREAALLEHAPFGVVTVDADLRIRQANAAALRMFGSIRGGVVDRDFPEVMGLLWEKSWAEEVVAVFKETLRTGKAHIHKAGGQMRIDRAVIEFYEWEVHRVPLGNGRDGLVCYFRDVSADSSVLRQLAENEDRFRALVHASAQIIWSTGPGLEIEEDLPSWRTFTGQSFEQMRGLGWLDAVPADEREAVRESVRRGMELAVPYEFEFRACHWSGAWRWLVARCVPLKDGDGKLKGWIGTSTDITDRKEAEKTQQLLIAELNHRVKNTLAGVQAIMQQTLNQTSDPAIFAERMSGRIQSMGRIHTLLASRSWKGTYLREIVIDQIGTAPAGGLIVDGPLVRLEPQMAFHLALMLHELASNATRYGAFSNGQGTVVVQWSLKERLLLLTWRERGGPPVSMPSRRGFGSKLIAQSAKGAGGHATMEMTAEGIVWHIAIPLLAEGTPAESQSGESGTRTGTLLPGTRFLVVEDEPLLVMDVTGVLEAAGAEVTAATSINRALVLIDKVRFDGVLLDSNLNGQTADAVAAALTRRRMPFVFVSGYGRDSLPAGYDNVPLLAKPFGEQALVSAAAAMLPKNASLAS